MSLMAIAFVLALFGCSSRKEIECEVFKIKDFDSKIATKAKDNVDYILIESHEEYFELFSYERVSNLTFEAYKKITSHMDGK